MDLFRTNNGISTDKEFEELLSGLSIERANIYLCSSLLSLGRPLNLKVPELLINKILERVGKEGTLSIPSYTFSAYNKQIFDPVSSKCIVGTLGETARKMPGFIRTFHPVYSHSVKGKNTELLNSQSPKTCFGKGSFFDIFCKIERSFIIVLGGSLSALAFYHYYDQLFSAPGRFVKKFKALVRKGEDVTEIEFDSYVKDYENFYIGDLMNCLGRFDALATELGLLQHIPFAGNYLHIIKEEDFRKLYDACLLIDQKYFLCSTKKEWEEYYPKNNFKMFHGKIDPEMRKEVQKILQSN